MNKFKAGRPSTAGRKPKVKREITDSAMRWRCFCATNIFKSYCCRCPRCGELAMLADDYLEQEQASYSPKVKASKQYDNMGKDITPKVEKKRSFTYTEDDHKNMKLQNKK